MRPRLIALIYVLPIVGGAAIVWAGIRLATTNLPVGLLLIAMGVVTVVLLVRVLLGSLSARDGTTPDGTTPNGDLTGPYFDYVMWVALGVRCWPCGLRDPGRHRRERPLRAVPRSVLADQVALHPLGPDRRGRRR